MRSTGLIQGGLSVSIRITAIMSSPLFSLAVVLQISLEILFPSSTYISEVFKAAPTLTSIPNKLKTDKWMSGTEQHDISWQRPQLEEAKPPLCPVSAWSKELWGCNPEIACSLLVNNKQRCSKPKKKNNGSIISHVSQAHDDLFIVRSVYTHITITLKVSLSLSVSLPNTPIYIFMCTF